MERKKGRPAGSKIRDNIVELLYFMKMGYGYQIYKAYREIFPAAAMRSIYHNLKTGAKLGIFELEKIETTKGDYSWGPEAEKVYYRLGKNAEPKVDEKVKERLDSINTNRPT